MSKDLVPVSGQVTQITTKLAPSTVDYQVLSEPYIRATKLEQRATEWQEGQRPIYRRLPAVGEAYQLFFSEENKELGYVYIPYGESYDGPGSLNVVATPSNKSVLVYGGQIAWKYGSNVNNPVLLDLETLGVESGRYIIAYELVYDDAPNPQQFYVNEFSLEGQPLNISAGTDRIPGWRFSPFNAFTSENSKYWTNYDPSQNLEAEPQPAILSWESKYAASLSEIVMFCPANKAIDAETTANLYIQTDAGWTAASSSTLTSREGQNCFVFQITRPVFVKGWKIEWVNPKIENPVVYIEKTLVSGTLVLLTYALGNRPKSSLVVYPENALPDKVNLEDGSVVTPSYCPLALVDVDANYNIEQIQDRRYTTHIEYVPVADWLTLFWDDCLTKIYDNVTYYARDWMNPNLALKKEYSQLQDLGIEVI